ncbi:hypothetical protein TNCV_2579321 [Trichonephila clavipes]|uniref:Uncharacterized protein n=1 Tax=Trichonephila clavipes TaxID=2585209 RepID=A0A8X6SAR7_TRICX|nr:hypothetical protein TNCV_2579321 [Trichonephila clavipes]
MPREGAIHHLIIVSYPKQGKRLKGNGCAIQHDFMLLTVRYVGFSLIEQICILKKPGVKTKHFRIRSYGTQSKGSLTWGVKFSGRAFDCADRKISGSNPGVLFSGKIGYRTDYVCIKSSNPRIYVTVWCQKWDFMPITRSMDVQLKALLETINSVKNSQEETKQEIQKGQQERQKSLKDMQKSQEDTKNELKQYMQKGLDDTKNELKQYMQKGLDDTKNELKDRMEKA